MGMRAKIILKRVGRTFRAHSLGHASHRGFTLIELLVVIAIIGVLASTVLASLEHSRSIARDAVRKSDLRQIEIALELYHQKHGTYRVKDAGFNGLGSGYFGYETGTSGSYRRAISRALYEEGFLPQPYIDDPLSETGSYTRRYMLYSSDDEYSVSAAMENPKDADIQHAYYSYNGGHADSSDCSDVPGSYVVGEGLPCDTTEIVTPLGIPVCCNAIVARYGMTYAVPR